MQTVQTVVLRRLPGNGLFAEVSREHSETELPREKTAWSIERVRAFLECGGLTLPSFFLSATITDCAATVLESGGLTPLSFFSFFWADER